MTLLVWSDALSVRVAEMDAQHRELFAMINDLHSAAQAGRGAESIGPILDRLVLYAREHFADEERYFGTLDYPGAAAHIEQHRVFSKNIDLFQKNLRQGARDNFLPLMKFLCDWFLGHIQGTDMAYANLSKGAGAVSLPGVFGDKA